MKRSLRRERTSPSQTVRLVRLAPIGDQKIPVRSGNVATQNPCLRFGRTRAARAGSFYWEPRRKPTGRTSGSSAASAEFSGRLRRAFRKTASWRIDDGATKRANREIAVGRGNRTFFGIDDGGETAAVLRSFIASCRRNRIEAGRNSCLIRLRGVRRWTNRTPNRGQPRRGGRRKRSSARSSRCGRSVNCPSDSDKTRAQSASLPDPERRSDPTAAPERYSACTQCPSLSEKPPPHPYRRS